MGIYSFIASWRVFTIRTTNLYRTQLRQLVQLNPADAVNYVSIITKDENGEILQPGVLNPNTGHSAIILFDRSLYFNSMSFLALSDAYVEFDAFDIKQSPVWNFYINDVSSRYSIIQSLVGYGYQQGDYFTKYETIVGLDESVSFEINPQDWTYHTEMFQPSQLGVSGVFKGYSTTPTFNGLLISGGWTVRSAEEVMPGDDAFKGFLNNAFDGDPANLLVSPSIADHFEIIDPTQGAQAFFIKGNPVVADGNGGVLYGSGDVSWDSFLFPLLATYYYSLDNKSVEILPFHPRFTFDTNPKSIKQGDNVPITITGFTKINAFKTANKGRYGENRESDYYATQIEVKQNGNVIFSGTYKGFRDFNLPASGQLEIVLTNANTLVDELEGKNTTTINYNASEADTPPTLQHLQFRNSDDEVTSVFDSSQDASLRLAAGDFKYTVIGGSNGYFAYEEGNSVALSYSIYSQNNWSELELTEYPEYFQMPAFGNYYEASLEGIGSEDDNVWYDIKVICTDAGGNKQEQIISPAFKINEALGVQDIITSSFVVYPNPFSEQLNIVLPKNMEGNYTFKVTDMIGRILYSNNQNDRSFSWNSSSLSKGVYILSIENNGQAIDKKVIKR